MGQTKKKTSEMTNCMDDLSLSSPKDRVSRSSSKASNSKRSYARSSSSGSSSTSRSSSSSSRSSRSRSKSQSNSRSQYYRSKRYRQDSRSPRRSCSRSYTPPHRKRYVTSYRRHYRSPPKYRSRSRSRSYSRFHYRRTHSRSQSRLRGGRYYSFVRRAYSPTNRSFRNRSQARSRSRSPLFLTNKDKRELLEIAKANATKAFGKEIELPASLRTDPWVKEKKNEVALKPSQLTRQTAEDSVAEKCSTLKSILFSSNNTVAKPVLQKQQNSNVKAAFSKTDDVVKRKSPYELWLPISAQKSFSSSLFPKSLQSSRSR
uniref:Arginine/serine-rich protein 1 n=1 Tax=Geotrypetes seraphini TaxID=260995 RepID=A0A6P8RXI5_GEOSA|nr:arginine/serine-rich protein 1 [Geotrypetes seraphini]